MDTQIGYRWLSKKSIWPSLGTGEALLWSRAVSGRNGSGTTAESRSSPGGLLSRDGEGCGGAGRAEDTRRPKPDAGGFKQCREGESSGLCPCSLAGVVQGVCSGGMQGGILPGCGSLWGRQLFLGGKRALEELLLERTLALLQTVCLVDFFQLL